LFLGGSEKTTLKDLTEALGKETIYQMNSSTSKGQSASYSQNQQKLGKSLMSEDELNVLDGEMCILQLRGVRPFLSKKYDITSHKHYKFLSDANPKNAFNLERHINRELVIKPTDDFDYFMYTPVDEELPSEVLNDFIEYEYEDEDFGEDYEPV
jgi:type IV secretion system protein VirD4